MECPVPGANIHSSLTCSTADEIVNKYACCLHPLIRQEIIIVSITHIVYKITLSTSDPEHYAVFVR